MSLFYFICIILVSIFSGALCEDEDNRIVGGLAAKPGSFSYQVSLRLSEKHHFCGGSILNERFILTAAHCLETMSAENITVVAGSHLLDAGGDRYEAELLIIHERYISRTHTHDIGLIRLKSPIVYNLAVQPIDLSYQYISPGSKLTLSGWGYTESNPNQTTAIPNELQSIELTSISFLNCRLAFVGQFLSFITPLHICTLNKEGEGACMGDSGGPLVSGDKQVGVVSWGIPCAKGAPDVFTGVVAYRSWITSNTDKKD